MKQHEILFSIFRIPLDFLSIYFAFFIAKEIRLITDLIPAISLPIQTIDSIYLSAYALFWWILYITLFASHNLYSLSISNSKIWEILDIIRYSIYWFIFFVVWVYLWNGVVYDIPEIPRLIIIFTLIIGTSAVIFQRIVIHYIQKILLKYKFVSKRNLLIISSLGKKDISAILKDIKYSKVYKLVWYCNSKKVSALDIKYLWWVDNIEALAEKKEIDEILYISSDFSKTELYTIWEFSRIYWVRYRYITNNFDVTKTNTSLSLINRTPVIEIKSTPLENWSRVWKRIFDIIFSLWTIILLLPFSIIIWILIKIEDPAGPIIYRNTRIGQKWQLFHCYKFRYLKWKYCIKESYGIDNTHDPAIAYEMQLIQNSNNRDGPLYKIKKDPRKTKIWTFLEKYSLDEIPQFINVLFWEMSIVWPRPHQPREVEKYEKYQNRLLTVKPWITWMAQVNGRDLNNFEKEAKLDIFYIENWSFLLDLKILLKTCTILFYRK